MTPPFFILGFPRSGTSALRVHLTSHTKLVVPPECSFVTWLYPRYGDWTFQDLFTPRAEKFVSDLLAARKFKTWRLSGESVRARISASLPATYADLAACVYEAFSAKSGKGRARWGDKNNIHLTQVDRLAHLYSRAQFVLIVRDVRGVLASVRDLVTLSPTLEFRPQLPSDSVELAREWREQNRAALASLEGLDRRRFTVIRYEDFVTHPRVVLGALTEFLGVEWDEGMLSAPDLNSRETLEPTETMSWKALTRLPLTTERIFRWRNRISELEADSAVSEAEPVFTALGYSR